MPSRREQVLFLDYDGVLHPDAVYLSRQGPVLRAKGELFMWAPVLVEILEDFQEVSLVLSTSWVRNLSFRRAMGFLPSDLGKRVTGATWHSSMARDWADDSKWDGRTRYDQISRYAARAQLANWVSLDDDPEGWGATAQHRLVACDPDLGLGNPQTQRSLIDVLQRMASR
ncbi:HAD domain-containing protein [Pseudomonas ficuserectae]|nr:HAD domain-containing protein [Pseudomonas ficuserectae]